MLAEILSEVSEWTWHFLRDAPFRPREETITESLITDFTRRGHGAVRVYKASLGEESDSGLDWAWAIETPSGWLHMLVQAKQVTGTALGWYDELRKPDADNKAGKLISAGMNFQAIPVYAFYNGEVMPFGPEGTVVKFGACGRASIERQKADQGLPWENGFSPIGITLAHAEDVRESVIVPPYTNQRAKSVNLVSLPWECLLCPNTVKVSASQPRIWQVAQALRSQGRPDAQSDDQGRAPWLSAEAPEWALLLNEGLDPATAENAPPANYFVTSRVPE